MKSAYLTPENGPTHKQFVCGHFLGLQVFIKIEVKFQPIDDCRV